MNSSGDAAESVVRMSLQGMEVVARISGSGAKNIGAILYALMKDQQKVKGKTTLTNMLKSGKELKVFTVKIEDLKKFKEEAKRYGVLFCALTGKNYKLEDGMVDIMVRAEDASKINRIVDRFKLSTYDEATIRSEIQKTKDKTAKEKGVQEKTPEEKLADDILSKPIDKEENEVSNPQQANMVKKPPSEPTLNNKDKTDQGTKLEKPSVREQIKEIRKQQEEKKDNKDLVKSDKEVKKEPNKTTTHKQPNTRKQKSKERGA